MQITKTAKSGLAIYILPTIIAIAIQLVGAIVEIGPSFGCESTWTDRCTIGRSISALLLYGAPLAGAGIVFIKSRSRRKALLFLLVFAGFEVLIYLSSIIRLVLLSD